MYETEKSGREIVQQLTRIADALEALAAVQNATEDASVNKKSPVPPANL